MVPLTAVLTGVVALLLMQQPNFGETIIFVAAWVLLLALVGRVDAHPRHARRGGGGAADRARLSLLRVATARIDGFLFAEGDKYQVESALRTLTAGGLFGAGPGAGMRKFQLPEPHTDYIFSVIGEEFGIIACLAIAILYMTIVVRVLIRLLAEEDKFLVLADGRAGRAVRAAGADQHGGQRPHRAVQGHDPAVHLLWRLVDGRAVASASGCCSPSAAATRICTDSPYVVKWRGLR